LRLREVVLCSFVGVNQLLPPIENVEELLYTVFADLGGGEEIYVE
jgi:hypothetical protein